MATRIAYETRAGRPVRCVVLTNGSGWGENAAVRDAESLAVLDRLGVAPEAVCFLGSRHDIPDGRLVHALEHVFALAEEHLGPTLLDQIFCLAWEGGHPDHDASHLIALALARERGLLGRVWQFPLYHGRGTPGGLFRVMAPLDASACRTRRIMLSDGLRTLLLPRLYRSQRRTWFALLPEALVKLALLRREVMQAATTEAMLRKPHAGRLYYERRFGVDYASWRAAAEPFIARRIVDQEAGTLRAERDC